MLINTQKTSHGRAYSKTVELDLSDLGLKEYSWAAVVLRGLATRSKHKPLHTSDFDLFFRVLKQLRNHLIFQETLVKQPKSIRNDDMRKLFADLENCIEQEFTWKDSTKSRVSMVFRKWVIEEIPVDEFGEDLSRHHILFKTKLTGRAASRPTLSDMGKSFSEEDEEPPVDALPHENIAELKQKISDRYDLDANRLIEACVKETQYWSKLRKTINDLAKLPYSDLELQSAQTYLEKGVGQKQHEEKIKLVAPNRLIGAIAKISSSKEVIKRIRGTAGSGNFGRQLLIEGLGMSPERAIQVPAIQITLMPLRAHFHELVAAFVLLLCYTAWNSSSLKALTADRIRRMSPTSFVITGYKSKTDQDTPEVFVDSSHKGAQEALELLLWNNAQLKSYGFIESHDQNCWYAWPKKLGEIERQQIGDVTRSINIWLKFYKLRKFSIEQIRGHMLMRIKNTKGTFEAARAAGHTSLAVTGNYLDQFLVKLQSKSINLEFQKRFEQTIRIYLQEGHERKRNEGSHQRRLTLIEPIGDGTSCTNPKSPPDPKWIVGGMCEGKNCHVGSGCPNNQIYITPQRVEEIARWARYYAANWQRLYVSNRDSFEKYHGPAILFNLALCEFLRKSLFWPDIKIIFDQVGLGGEIGTAA